MHAIHITPWDLLCAVSFAACLLVAAYYQGKAAERRQCTGRRFRLPVPRKEKRLDVFIAPPRRHLLIDLSQSSSLEQRVFIDRQV